MQLFGALVFSSLLRRLSALKRNVESRDCATIVAITWLPLRLSLSSLVRRSIFCTKNADGELSFKYKDIQFKYVGNLDKLKLFRNCMEAFDMFDPILIPVWIDPHAFSVMDRWGDRKSNAINLTKHWSKVSLEHVCAWQRDTFDWCTDDNNLTSMEWVKEFLTNSCDINLVKHVDEK